MLTRYKDPLEENYYALLLAIVYPYFITPDEAIEAIKHGMNPLEVTPQTVSDAYKLSKMRRVPDYFCEKTGRRREVVLMLSEIISETNRAMQHLRDYELGVYRENIVCYMKNIRERMEKNSIR